MAGNPELAELTRRYLPAATPDYPIFEGDCSWDPIIDGVEYFAQIDDLLQQVGPGDAVLIAGLQISPEVDLHGRSPGDEGFRPLVDQLAQAAYEGVDVRVLLSGGVFSGGVSFLPIGPFRSNVEAARTMRGWLPSAAETGRPPLRDQVLIDWSGAGIGTNHQKMIVFRIGGALTAFVGGLDLSANRFDANPHDSMMLGSDRWGWHDGAVRIHGPAAERVWDVYRYRWEIAAALPRRYWLLSMGGMGVLNPPLRPLTVPPAPAQEPLPESDHVVTVARSFNAWAIDSVRLFKRVRRPEVPRGGVREIFETLAAAINGASRYVYVEDQYFYEMPGGFYRYTLYGPLRDAATRGVKIILVSSGRKDPADGGDGVLAPVLTFDLRHRLVDRLPDSAKDNVMMYRVKDLTVHTKVTLVDDTFACIGSANFFGRSMVGTDTELSSAIVTTGTQVRDLRVDMWAEHLRAPLTDELRPSLENLDLALGIWRSSWLPADAPEDTWRRPDSPPGFAPRENVLLPARYSRRKP